MHHQVKTIFQGQLTLIILGVSLYSFPTAGKMKTVPRVEVSVQTIESHYVEILKKDQLTSEQSTILTLAKVAKNVFNVNSYQVQSFSNDTTVNLVKKIDTKVIAKQILLKISKLRIWNKQVSRNHMKYIFDHRELLEAAFEDHPYGWAWFLNQMGEADKAKKTLKVEYEKEYRKVMNLDKLIFGFRGQSPLRQFNLVSKALISLSTKYEVTKLEEKNRKLKVHVSNLPQSHIKT